MSQYSFSGNTVVNQSFPDTRTALNSAYAALASNSSGDNDPTSVAGGSLSTVQHQWWYDSTNNKLMLRNDANNAWIEIATIDETSGNVLSITTQGLTLGATALTATGAEINKLSGATVSTTELNQLDAITRGSILYGNASGATARLAKGAADTVLTSDGTDISWQAASSGGGGRTLISTTTISDDANVLIEGLDSTYGHYQFVISDYLNATGNNSGLLLRYKSGGSVDTGTNYKYTNIRTIESSSSITIYNVNSSYIELNKYNATAAPEASLIVFDIFNAGDGTNNTTGFSMSISPNSATLGFTVFRNTFVYEPATAVTGVQFVGSSGNMGSGTIKLYGIS